MLRSKEVGPFPGARQGAFSGRQLAPSLGDSRQSQQRPRLHAGPLDTRSDTAGGYRTFMAPRLTSSTPAADSLNVCLRNGEAAAAMRRTSEARSDIMSSYTDHVPHRDPTGVRRCAQGLYYGATDGGDSSRIKSAEFTAPRPVPRVATRRVSIENSMNTGRLHQISWNSWRAKTGCIS